MAEAEPNMVTLKLKALKIYFLYLMNTAVSLRGPAELPVEVIVCVCPPLVLGVICLVVFTVGLHSSRLMPVNTTASAPFSRPRFR